jgi:glutamate carboxypeptidase
VKTARKGTAEVRITVEGRAAHAANDHADGANAVVEAAHVALRAAALHDPEAATVCVGVLHGGDRRNVVPDRAQLALDVRSFDPAAIEAVFAALRSAPATVPGTRVLVEGEMHRPPMPRTPAIAGLYATAAAIAAELAFDLPEHAVGGGSEANLAAGAGATVLDGLGPVGAGSHALDEHVVVASLVERAALLAGLVAELQA